MFQGGTGVGRGDLGECSGGRDWDIFSNLPNFIT